MSLALVPARFAFADQVLELPSAAAPPATSAVDATPPNDTAVSAPRKSHHQTVAAVPANLGTLQDYERETDEDPSVGGPSNYANFAGAPTHPPFEINGNSQQSLAQNAILGVLLIGLFAMEANAGHHHRHH